MTEYIVHWEYIDGPAIGFGGHGGPLTKDAAEAWAIEMNRRHKGFIEHWVEPATEDDNKQEAL